VRPSAPASILSRPIAARSSLTSHRTPISKRAVPKLAATKEDAATTEEHKVGVEKTGPNFSAIRDINAIMQTLPHRYPFLLVDRVVEWEKEKYAVGYKCVTINDNFFTGHFPERPIMPGVLQVEAMAQLAGIALLDPENTESKGLFFFGGVDGCRFRKPVVPGDVLMMRAEITKYNKRFGVVKAMGKGYVGDELVVEAELTLAMGK